MSMTKMDETLLMLKELTDVNVIAGNESQPREVMKRMMEPYADSITFDGIGSLIAEKKAVSRISWRVCL